MSPDPASSTNFDAAVRTWKDVALPSLQKSMDTTALEVVELQKEHMIGRKKLAEQTRDFKRLPDDTAKLASIKGLLKAYQQEIDSLTRRSQRSESTFLNVYKLLAEVPDPYPLLEAAIAQTIQVQEAATLKMQLTELCDENQSLHAEIKALKSAEEGRKKAESRVSSLEEKMESILSERIQQKENELSARYDERLRNHHEREVDLQKQLKTLREQLTDLHTSNEDTQARLANASQRLDHDTVTKLVELDTIVDELQRANERVATVERRNELLRSEIERVRSDTGETDRVNELRKHVGELEAEIAQMTDATDHARRDRSALEQESRLVQEKLERDLSDARREILGLRIKLEQYSDYDEVKRELEILKFIEFASGDNVEADDVKLPNPLPGIATVRLGGSLEALFAQKNKKLQEENARLRVSHQECRTKNEDLKTALLATQNENARQSTLIETLENDLIRMQMGGKAAGKALGSDRPPIDDNYGGIANTTPPDFGHRAENMSLSGLPSRLSKDRLEATVGDSGLSDGDRSLLPIVTGQRDRFRQRNAELEEELRHQYRIISELRAEIKTLQTDNLKLYEKVRYMQSYRHDMAIQPGQGTNGSAVLTDIISGSVTKDPYNGGSGPRPRDGDLAKYRDKYEQSMNPFEAFRGREARRAVQALNPLERAVFALTRKVVADKKARNAFILYTGALHALLVYLLYGQTDIPGAG